MERLGALPGVTAGAANGINNSGQIAGYSNNSNGTGANKPFSHGGKGYTRIVYIGTTGSGISRIAGSASVRIKQAIDERTVPGLRRLDAYVVWAKGKRGAQTIKGRKFWSILESALLIRFRDKYGEPPALNGTGYMKENGEFEVFSRDTLDRIINRYC
jgi:hypothetical protein